MGPARKREPEIDVGEAVRAVLAVQRMPTGQLRQELERRTGQPCRTWNKTYLQRRVAGLIQAQARSEGALRQDDVEARGVIAQGPSPGDPGNLRVRDPRLPAPGSEIVRTYRGVEIRVRVLDDGYEYQGIPFRTLTALAKAVTGQRSISGWSFFGFAKRERKK